MSPLQVGDKGIFRPSHRGAHDIEAIVVKVGRKWAILDYPSWGGIQVSLEDGVENLGSTGIGSPGRFFTPDMLATHERLVAAKATLKAHRLNLDFGHRWSNDEIVELAEWLRVHRAEAEQ